MSSHAIPRDTRSLGDSLQLTLIAQRSLAETCMNQPQKGGTIRVGCHWAIHCKSDAPFASFQATELRELELACVEYARRILSSTFPPVREMEPEQTVIFYIVSATQLYFRKRPKPCARASLDSRVPGCIVRNCSHCGSLKIVNLEDKKSVQLNSPICQSVCSSSFSYCPHGN
jgi:hypothetical protein